LILSESWIAIETTAMALAPTESPSIRIASNYIFSFFLFIVGTYKIDYL
jgi:hypothetical protein